MPDFAWSYSAIKTFRTCPRQYYHYKVLKDIPYEQNAEAAYGDRMHKAIEAYGKHGTALPQEFQFVQSTVDQLLAFPGKKLFEHKMALTEELAPTAYFAKDTWWRGAADLLILDEKRGLARVLDWKAGKSKNADASQLELMALAIFHTFPSISRVKAGLVFLTEDKFIPAKYTIDRRDEYWQNWLGDLERLSHAYKSGVWNAKTSGLCSGWCPVKSCEHWKPKR